jgi:hypothetical protein
MPPHQPSPTSGAQPNISLAWLASGLPFEHEADKAHYLGVSKGRVG